MSQVYKADINGDGSTPTPQGFLDYEGVKHLWSKVSMKDYPNNETLAAVINAIDETKADKSELFSGSWNDLADKPTESIEDLVIVPPTATGAPGAGGYRKISDITPTIDELKRGCTVYLNDSTVCEITIDDITIGDTSAMYNIGVDYIITLKCTDRYDIYILPKETAHGSFTGYTFDKGIYAIDPFYKIIDNIIIQGKEVISENYIPSTIARISDIPMDTVTNSELHTIAKSGSWNDLNDKPTEFIGRTIIYGRTSINNTPSGGIWYYVSNKTPTLEEFAYGCKLVRRTGEIIKEFTINDLTLGKFLSSSETNNICGKSYFYILPQDTYISQSLGTLPAGTYFAPINADGNIQQTSRDISYNLIINGREVIKDEHIPDTIARVSDIPNQLHPIAKSGSWDLIENKPLNHIPKATISKPNGSFVSIHLDDFVLLSGVMPTLEDFSEGYDVITSYPVETVHYDSSTILTGDYFDSGFYNVYDSNGQFIIFYEDGKLSDGRDVEKGTYLNTSLITSLIVKPQTVLDPVQIKVDWDGVINKPDNFALREEFHEIARSGSWNDLEDKPFSEEEGQEEIIIDDIPLWVLDESEYLEEPHYNANYTADNNISFVIGDTYRLESDRFLPEGEDGPDYSYPMPLVETVCESETQLSFYSLPIRGEVEGFLSIECDGTQTISLTSKYINSNIKLIHVGRTVINTLEEKYIPDTIARVSDIDFTPYETKTDATAKLEEAKTFASEEDAKVQGAVDTLSGKVTTLIGEDTDKSIRTIANEELAKRLIAESAKESLDTLTEIAAWIQSHPDDVSAINKAINDLEALVGTLPDGVAATTIVDYIQEIVAANKALIDANTEAIGTLHTVANSGSWNDLEDKPFEDENNYVTVIQERTFTNGSSISPSPPYHYFGQPGTYIITIDGNNIYSITKNAGPEDMGDPTYEAYPFYLESRGSYSILTFKDEQSHLVKIEYLKSTSLVLKENFIPSSIARVSYVDSQIENHTHDFETLINKPFYENITYQTLYQSYGSYPGSATAAVTSDTLAEGEYYMRFNGVNYSFFITNDTTKIGPNENFPFVFQKTRSGQYSYTWLLQSVDTSTSFTYALVSVNRDIKQLDKKFIPTEIVNRVDNSLTNNDIVIIEVDEIFPKSAQSAIKAAVDNNKIIIAKVKSPSGKIYTTTQVGYEENNFSVVYPIGTHTKRLITWDNTVSYVGSFINQSVAEKLKTWDEGKSGDTEWYPSVNAMEEYVQLQLSKELTANDAIALATETGLIDPIATTSDNTILTDVNNNIITL